MADQEWSERSGREASASQMSDTVQVVQLTSDLKAVLAVSRAMSLERDLRVLLDLIVTAASDLVNADRCSLFLIDRERGELWTTVAQDSGEIRLPLGQGIAGTVAQTGAVVSIPDAYADERFNPEHDRATGYRTCSILCLPLIDHQGRIIGALQALNKMVDRRALRNASEQVRYRRARRSYERLIQEQVDGSKLIRGGMALALAAMDYGDDDLVFELLAEIEALPKIASRDLAALRTLRARLENRQAGTERFVVVPFASYDAEVLGALCAQAAVSIENARLIASDLELQQMARDMALARDIQAGLLPDGAPELPGWRCAAWYDPCDQTSGDYYDYIMAGEACDCIIGDVTGHGIGAALIMSSARAFLRGLYRQTYDMGVILTDLNALLEHDMADDVFMTMAVVRLHPDGRVDFVSAGHEAPLIYRIADDRFDTLPTGGLILGALEEADYAVHAVAPLAPGDLVVQFTDGIFEAFAPDGGEAFGLERMHAVVRDHAGSGAAGVVAAFRRAIHEHLGGQPAQDDITLVVAERMPCS